MTTDAALKTVPMSGQHVPTEYTLSLLPEDSADWDVFSLRVQYRGEGRWAVVRGPYCLSADDTWTPEPTPSSRTEEWIARHRFPLEDAIARARRVLPTVRINGHTAADALAMYERCTGPDA